MSIDDDNKSSSGWPLGWSILTSDFLSSMLPWDLCYGVPLLDGNLEDSVGRCNVVIGADEWRRQVTINSVNVRRCAHQAAIMQADICIKAWTHAVGRIDTHLERIGIRGVIVCWGRTSASPRQSARSALLAGTGRLRYCGRLPSKGGCKSYNLTRHPGVVP